MATVLFTVLMVGVSAIAIVITLASIAIQTATEFVKTLMYPLL